MRGAVVEVVAGGAVVEVVAGGAVVVTGGTVTGVVVVGAAVRVVVGTSVKMTSEVGTVVPGARATVVVGRAAALVDGVGTVRATATVVVVVELGPNTATGLSAAAPAVNRSPASVVDVAVTVGPGLRLGRVAFANDEPEESRATALPTRTTTMAATPSARRAFMRAVRLVACNHSRILSGTGGRPKAAFLPMDQGEG